MTALERIEAMIIDLDGVVWRGGTFLPAAQEFFETLDRRRIRFVLATNNATQTPESFQARLQSGGVEVPRSAILTSSLATAAYLAEQQAPPGDLLVIGADGLRSALQERGYRLVNVADSAQAVVVGMDTEVCWQHLAEATLAIRRGVPFIGTNPDPSFPSERGEVPGNGAILAALQAASGQAPTVIGKPEPHLYQQAVESLAASPQDTLIVGDRLETDILGGIRLGAPTALILTGVTTRAQTEASDIRSDYVFEDLRELISELDKG